jgi:hypothetical protein
LKAFLQPSFSLEKGDIEITDTMDLRNKKGLVRQDKSGSSVFKRIYIPLRVA